MGIDGRRYDIQLGTVCRRYDVTDGNLWQARKFTEMVNNGRRYDIQKWELKAGDTIYRDGN